MVERQLPKLNVAGSIPVSRSNPVSQPQSIYVRVPHLIARELVESELSLNCHGLTFRSANHCFASIWNLMNTATRSMLCRTLISSQT